MADSKGFKARPAGKSPTDLLTVLTNSSVKTDDNALYQTVFGLITQAQKGLDSLATKMGVDDVLPATQISGTLPLANGGTLAAAYLPVLTDVANIDVSAAFYTYWTRIANLVTVWGKVTIDPTAAGTLTELELTLPFPSGFEHEEQLSGTFVGSPFAGSTVTWSGICKANPVTHCAVLSGYSTDTVDTDVRFMFSYLFIPLS